MNQHSVPIRVDPLARPRIPLVVAFPGDVVEFTVENGAAWVFIPWGDQIFDDLNGNHFFIDSAEESTRRLTVGANFSSSERGETLKSHGALVIKYAIHCTHEGGEAYFAEGNSAPKIIIPKGPGG
jgi:hypothetical protein